MADINLHTLKRCRVVIFCAHDSYSENIDIISPGRKDSPPLFQWRMPSVCLFTWSLVGGASKLSNRNVLCNKPRPLPAQVTLKEDRGGEELHTFVKNSQLFNFITIHLFNIYIYSWFVNKHTNYSTVRLSSSLLVHVVQPQFNHRTLKMLSQSLRPWVHIHVPVCCQSPFVHHISLTMMLE